MGKIIEFNEGKVANEAPIQEQSKPNNQNIPFLKCEKCGAYRFTDIYLLREVTPIEQPTLTANTVVPILLYQCLNCGQIKDLTKYQPYGK